MANSPTGTFPETPVRLKDGGHVILTLSAVAVAALNTPGDAKYDVFAEVGGRNIPAITLVRNALGQDPWNTNAAEMALRELGFSILVRRRFDNATGEPVRLTREQISDSSV
ncbi:hypothetical protein ACFYUH_25305 [Streptomyces fimicarius]|uniref:hypothetical protein n=1 Tax=Streptomyces griseus TaxID=1911 RepID=UPI00368CDA67